MIVLGAGFLTALSVRRCSPDPAVVPLRSRSVRSLWLTHLTVLGDRDGLSPTAIQFSSRMTQRGHVALPPTPTLRELPFELTTTALEGACGVVVLEPNVTSEITRVTSGSASYAPEPPGPGRLASVGVCDVERVRALGTGSARAWLWTVPGLTPADVEASGLSAEAAIAFSEAEALLHHRGWVATNRAVRADLDPGAHTWRPPRPSEGCVAWVVAAFGFSDASSNLQGDSMGDARPGRQLLGAISCDDGGEVTLRGASADGGTIYALPFRYRGGPRMPEPAASRLTGIADVRVVPPADLELTGEP